MNNGGMVYIEPGRIRLSEDLLRPLSLTEGSHLTGVFYPTPEDNGYEHVERTPDFMLTPIPFWTWPVAAGLRIELKHQRGSLSTITEFLNDQKINIVSSQCTRSGHRYATWNLIIEFEALRGDGYVPLAKLEELSRVVPQKARALENEITEKCGHVLQEATSPYLRTPVIAWALRSLSNFYQIACTSQDVHQKRLGPFNAHCISPDTVTFDPTGIYDWSKLSKELLPTLGFASLDTEHFNVRIAILQRSRLKRFRSVSFSFSWSRDNRLSSSRGILNSIMKDLKDDWNLWRVYSKDQLDETYEENRTIQIFMESVKEYDSNHIDDEVKKKLEAIPPQIPGLRLRQPVTVLPISNRRIFVSIRNRNTFKRSDEFIERVKKLAGQIGILAENVVTVNTYIAESLTREVTSTIASCQGMIQFYMGTAAEPNFDWLNSEFFLICYLQKPCIRFVSPELKDRLIFQLDHPPRPLASDASNLEVDNAIISALWELDKEMRRLGL